ncbi:hypothetical protein ONE63_006293 [Megalurothrips usitatus]|uniref:Peptidase S1 domain-containing protein n=1 Tax=Megalurothrips usitatus TaxID=439358 RepID=A0AAV7XTY2_9NEOP|nr:hypothetical protein ONE63_006293 [Megalurothrips usitatus]
MRSSRRGPRAGAPVLALALVLAIASFCVPSGTAAERSEQDCFCTGLWTCLARTGLPYSACDQQGMRVICCVMLPAAEPSSTAAPATPTAAPPAPQPASSNEVEEESVDLNTDADTHFRYSTGRPAAPTTATPGGVHRHRHGAPTSTPSTFATTAAFDEDEDDDDDDEDDLDEDAEDVPFRTSTTARPPHSTTPRARPSRPAARPFSVFVTPVPSAAQLAQPSAPARAAPQQRQQQKQRKQQKQQEEWDDSAPDTDWSDEDAAAEAPRQQQTPQQRDPKKIDWTNIVKSGGRQQQQQQRQRPPAAATAASAAPLAVPWTSWKECGFKGTDSELDGVAEPSEWPWHAALLEAGSDRYVCGATLVGPDWLLTAAHCIADYPEPSALKVRVGELDVRSDAESFTQERAVVQLVPHPAFDLPSLRHDIALVRIARPPRDQRNVAAVCLPPPLADDEEDDGSKDEDGFPREGTVCVVTGWGRRDEVSPHSEVLKEVPVPIWSRRPCQDALRAHLGQSFRLPRTSLCAGAKGRDACDVSAGRLSVRLTGGAQSCHANAFVLGIVSYGIGCGRNNSPGVYTKLSSYTAWVRSVTGALRSLDIALPAPRPAASRATPGHIPAVHAAPAAPTARSPPQSPRPSPRKVTHPLPAPAVSRVRVNHYTGSAPTSTTTSTSTSRTPTRNVVVLTREDLSSEEDEDLSDAVTEQDQDEGRDGPSSAATATTPPPTTATTSTVSSTTTQAPRSGRAHGGSGSHSAGVSYFRSSFGSSGWSYPLEGPKASATVAAPQRVLAVAATAQAAPEQDKQSHKWYSPSYSGSYRGTVAGVRLPGQILSNVVGRTAAGLNRWYSPYYSGSYRGDYNAFPKDDGVASKDVVDTVAPRTAMASTASPTTVAPKAVAAFNVRPPLAAPRWYAPLHEETATSGRWYTSFHNGTYRTGYVSGLSSGAAGKHRFATESGGSGGGSNKLDDKVADHDLTWTYLVKTGAQGTVIMLNPGNSSSSSSSGEYSGRSSGAGLRGEATAYHPSVADGTRQGRTLVNFTNTFSYPSAPGPHRNASHPRAAGAGTAGAGTSLSSSYSIYRIYPSVYNPEYRAGPGAKSLEPSNISKPSVSGPAAGPSAATPETSRNSIVGYSHFSSGGTAVHFNITHEPSAVAAPRPGPTPGSALANHTTAPPALVSVASRAENAVENLDDDDDVPVVTTITALDLTTLRAATAEDSTMDVPPVAVMSTTEAETNAPTATASPTGVPTESVTTIGTETTTRDVMTTTEVDLPARGRGREGRARAEEDEQQQQHRSVVSTLARRGGGGGGQPTADSRFAPRHHRLEASPEAGAGAAVGAPESEGPEAGWGDKTRRAGRTQTTAGARGGRRPEAQANDGQGQHTATAGPRPRSRGRARPQQQVEEAVSFIPRRPAPAPAPAPSPRSNKDRAAFHPGPGVRHSRPVDVGNPPETVFVHSAPDPTDGARTSRARGRRPSAATPPPPPPPPPAPTPTPATEGADGAEAPEGVPFVAEVKPPRPRGQGRSRKGKHAAVSAAASMVPTAPADPEIMFTPTLSSTPAPQRHQYLPQRSFAKKPRKQTKKVVLTSSEVQEPADAESTPSSPSPAPSPRHSHHQAWFPSDVAADVGADAVDDVSVEPDAVEDLEREDIYSFLSQRAKRRRGKASSSSSSSSSPQHAGPLFAAETSSSPPTSSEQGDASQPQPPRWGGRSKGASARRRGQSANEE